MEIGRRVLVVDGDSASRERIAESLKARGIATDGVGSAEAALSAVDAELPDLIVLELYLPDQSGLGLCRVLRETPRLSGVPIMVVSGQSSEIDRVLAFEAGADDFLAKPFYSPELAARVAAILRGFASRDANRPEFPNSSPLRVDLDGGRAELEGRALDLTRTELQILAALAGRAGKVVRRRELIERLWGSDAPQSDRAIDAHVKSIRRKLGGHRELLTTVRGVGYRFGD